MIDYILDKPEQCIKALGKNVYITGKGLFKYMDIIDDTDNIQVLVFKIQQDNTYKLHNVNNKNNITLSIIKRYLTIKEILE